MRIAVSGTHCTGKSTLIDEFLRAHSAFAHEPEPYAVLVDELGEEFSAEPRVEDFLRQLEFNFERLKHYSPDQHVIFERCPIDFLAYLHTLDTRSVETVLGPISEAMKNLDLIVYLPLDETIEATDEEFPKLRKAVDRRLSAIYREDEFEIVAATDVAIVEASGSTGQRLRIVEAAMSHS